MNPVGLSSIVASWLIALDKKPGVRPIGIVKLFFVELLDLFYQAAAGPLQLCAEQLLDCKTAVHCVRQHYFSSAIILVDVLNAFNSLNQTATLYNI